MDEFLMEYLIQAKSWQEIPVPSSLTIRKEQRVYPIFASFILANKMASLLG
jgi:hypothetical protein